MSGRLTWISKSRREFARMGGSHSRTESSKAPSPLPSPRGEGVWSLFFVLAKFGEDRIVFERCCVAGGFFASRDIAQKSAHDFTAPRFWQGAGEADFVRLGKGADFVTHMFFELVAQGVGRLAVSKRDK